MIRAHGSAGRSHYAHQNIDRRPGIVSLSRKSNLSLLLCRDPGAAAGTERSGGRRKIDTYLGIGNASKDPIRGPGINVFDVSLYKNIPFSSNEQRRLQLRFEFYNFFNHASFQGVDTGARVGSQGKQVNANFGAYTSTLDARRVVLGAKVYF